MSFSNRETASTFDEAGERGDGELFQYAHGAGCAGRARDHCYELRRYNSHQSQGMNHTDRCLLPGKGRKSVYVTRKTHLRTCSKNYGSLVTAGSSVLVPVPCMYQFTPNITVHTYVTPSANNIHSMNAFESEVSEHLPG